MKERRDTRGAFKSTSWKGEVFVSGVVLPMVKGLIQHSSLSVLDVNEEDISSKTRNVKAVEKKEVVDGNTYL